MAMFENQMKVLLLLAGLTFASCIQAEAQIDSNAHVTIYVGQLRGSCTINWMCHASNNDSAWNGGISTIDSSVSLNLTGRISMSVPSGANFGYYWDNNYMFASIDTSNQQFGCTFDILQALPSTSQRSGRNSFRLNLELPYQKVGNSLIASARVNSGLNFSAERHTFYQPNYCDAVGGIDTTIVDTFYIAITPLTSSVYPIPKSQQFEVHNTNPVSFFFPAALKNRHIEILDALGRIMHSLNIDEAQTSTLLKKTLPPGCYFARLGDTVVKLLIME